MREVIPVARARAEAQDGEALQRQVEAANERARLRTEHIAQNLAEEFEPLEQAERREIRKAAALALPLAGPLTRPQQQEWLDEMCLGVARYMRTGKIL